MLNGYTVNYICSNYSMGDVRQETGEGKGDRRCETVDGRQEPGDRRRETGRQKTGRQETGDRRHEKVDMRQEYRRRETGKVWQET